MVYVLRVLAAISLGFLSTPLWTAFAQSPPVVPAGDRAPGSPGVVARRVEDDRSPAVRPPSWAKCPDYWPLARKVGWKHGDMAILDKVMYKESRCLPEVFNGSDPVGGSRGLTQINGFWHKILRRADIMDSPRDLYDPEVNLRAALLIYTLQKETTGWGWSPWAIHG